MFILEFTLLEGQQKGDQHKIFIFNLELHVEYLYFATWWRIFGKQKKNIATIFQINILDINFTETLHKQKITSNDTENMDWTR